MNDAMQMVHLGKYANAEKTRYEQANEDRLNENFRMLQKKIESLQDGIQKLRTGMSTYGSVNGDVSIDGVLDVVQRRCFATLSSSGWYRVMQTKDVSGTIIDFRIGRPYGANPAEAHKISFYIVGGGKSAFLDETSDTNTLCVDKIRATYGGGLVYFDVHYNASSANEVLVYFDVYGKGQANGTSIAMGLESVADAPSGETVLTTHTFFAQTDAYISLHACGKYWCFRKRNGIVYVLAPNDVTSASSGSNSIGTLPVGWRPEATVVLACANYISANCWLIITAAGTVSFCTSVAISSARNAAFSGSYPAYS